MSSFNSFDGKKECYQRADFDVSKNQVIKITQKQRINTEHKLLRFDLEKRVAKTLIERGYGYQKIKEISANTYSSLITSIVKTGLRTLTFLLINETNIPIIGFTQTEELKLRSPMAHGWEGLP